MMNRLQKLQTLKDRRTKATRKSVDERTALLDKLDERMQEFRSLMGEGIEVKNTEELLVELKELKGLSPTIEKLQSTIEKIEAPNYPKTLSLDNIGELKTALETNTIDLSPIKQIAEEVRSLTEIIAKKEVKAGQKPEDFIPFRRVIKVDGVGLKYDDSFYTGGGGGSNVPTVNGSVPVVNPDGSNISSSSSTTTNYATRVDDTTTENVTYLGKAIPGSANGDPVWQIQKIDETAGTVITWADGNDNFDNIWNNRASLIYS